MSAGGIFTPHEQKVGGKFMPIPHMVPKKEGST